MSSKASAGSVPDAICDQEFHDIGIFVRIQEQSTMPIHARCAYSGIKRKLDDQVSGYYRQQRLSELLWRF